MSPKVDVYESGAVRLGNNIVCDGFVEGFNFRVQTHVHDDHMGGFATSKGQQDIYLSSQTFQLLVKEFGADLQYRTNLHKFEQGLEYEIPTGEKLLLLSSNHMLGACQVQVTLDTGFRIGYSGDFGWPVDEVIKVDELVVDSTYGSPMSVREYSQQDAELCLYETVCQRLRHGPVHIKAFRGTIERTLMVLNGGIGVPILASDRLIGEVSVYQKNGLPVGNLIPASSDDGRHAITQRSYIQLYAKGDGFRSEPLVGTSIICSAYYGSRSHPLTVQSDRALAIGLSNHADFRETLDYVKATNATTVITDNTRRHGCELAIAINEHLKGVNARPSTNESPPRWR